MMEQLDMNVGKLVKYLKNTGELDNTIIFYLSDNGVSAYDVSPYFNAPYIGRKGMLREGGIKTPLIVHWPAGQYDKRRTINKAFHIMDIAPTCLDIVDTIEYKNLDGISFKSYLTEKLTSTSDYYLDREYLFWSDRDKWAVIDKDGYKLVDNALYDLRNDPCETVDISGENRGFMRSLRKAYIDYKVNNNIEPLKKVERLRISKSYN